ncbi:MAG: hypothetical protein F6K24_28680 [Okeania sp. SIO2D1]|nr:hypothetical protein [Okeania sp. SIO2D1]
MKKWFTLILTLAAIGPLTLTGTLAEAVPEGKVALQVADTGKFMARCRDCQSTVVPIPDTVTLRDGYNVGHAQFTVVPVSAGKIALKADIGQYVARCNGCIVDGATRDFLIIRKDDPNNPNVQFTPELLPNGNYALKSNSGQYVARCNGCSPTAAARGVTQDTVTVHVDNPTSKLHAQWKIIPVR